MTDQPASIPVFSLNDGHRMPSVGKGCWMGEPGGAERVYEMCKKALKLGYRHFDTKYVGKAIRESGVPRSEIFVTTKLGFRHDLVAESCEASLKELDCEYIDMYLMHWPQSLNTEGTKILQPDESPTYVETWLEMEKLLKTGKVKSIGVSNFSIQTLDVLLPHCTVIPAVNQIQMHPCLPQHDLKAYCASRNILLTACPVFDDGPEIKAIAGRLGVTVAQVVLSWGVQRGTSVVPKSENEGRMLANITLVKLTEEDMRILDTFHRKPGMHKNLYPPMPGNAPGTVFGWTYEQLGWNLDENGVAIEIEQSR
ncbi:Aldo/keto reductase [Mycena sp. CBHHK59/15]|nr:Aldo/keto reductase [Mycena sp. CBHHK59/15]